MALKSAFTAAVVMAVGLLASAQAQQVTTSSGPSKGAVTPEEISRRLETRAGEIQTMAPSGAARFVLFDFAWPETAEEYRGLGKHAVVLVAAVSQKAEELPLRRVYTKANGRIIALVRLSGERRELPAGSVARKIFGPYREDGFYLVPAGAFLQDYALLCDFAVNRNEFVINSAPLDPPSFILADRNRTATKPKAAMLKLFLAREFPGFPHGP